MKQTNLSEFERMKREATETKKQDEAIYVRPQYEEEKKADGSIIMLHCGICGATWTGKWEHEARHGQHRPIYDGGVVWYQSRERGEHAFRCKCQAGAQRGNAIPEAPPWFWHLSGTQGTPGRARYPSVKEESND